MGKRIAEDQSTGLWHVSTVALDPHEREILTRAGIVPAWAGYQTRIATATRKFDPRGMPSLLTDTTPGLEVVYRHWRNSAQAARQHLRAVEEARYTVAMRRLGYTVGELMVAWEIEAGKQIEADAWRRWW